MSQSFADILDAKLDGPTAAETPRVFRDPEAAFYSLRDHYFLRDIESKTFAPRNPAWVGVTRPHATKTAKAQQESVKQPSTPVQPDPTIRWTPEARLAWIELSAVGLGLSEKGLSGLTLKKAWRRLALRIHPDHNNGVGSPTFARAHTNYVKLCAFLKKSAT